MFDPKNMKARFAELTAQRDKIMSASAPLRTRRDEVQAQLDAAIQPLNAEIKKIEAGLYGIEQERAIIARALGGKTG